jgi:hypothetical protein
MTSKAARCAIACRLDQIPSAIFDPEEQERRVEVRRRRPAFCPPVVDQIDLAERLHTLSVPFPFVTTILNLAVGYPLRPDQIANRSSWAVFMLDCCVSIATCMPPNLDFSSITTPLPSPWALYEHASHSISLIRIKLMSPVARGASHGTARDPHGSV